MYNAKCLFNFVCCAQENCAASPPILKRRYASVNDVYNVRHKAALVRGK